LYSSARAAPEEPSANSEKSSAAMRPVETRGGGIIGSDWEGSAAFRRRMGGWFNQTRGGISSGSLAFMGGGRGTFKIPNPVSRSTQFSVSSSAPFQTRPAAWVAKFVEWFDSFVGRFKTTDFRNYTDVQIVHPCLPQLRDEIRGSSFPEIWLRLRRGTPLREAQAARGN